MGKQYTEYLKERLMDPEFCRAYEENEGEFQAMRALYLARKEEGITQKELSSRTRVPQKTISNIETGNVNTSVNTLAKIARGLGRELKIEFV